MPDLVKKDRHNRMVALYRRKCQLLNEAEIGNIHLILVEGTLNKTGQLIGRNEFYTKVVFDQQILGDQSDIDIGRYMFKKETGSEVLMSEQQEIGGENGSGREIVKGDYIAVRIVGAKSSVLTGVPLFRTRLTDFYRDKGWAERAVYRL